MSDIKNIKSIYIYRIMGLCVSFASIFIVIPFLAEDVSAYAIYAFVGSICFFLTYGDLGFLGAAQKYCAEEVGKGELRNELKYVGFVMAILGVLSFSFSFLMLIVSFKPQILLTELTGEELYLASNLFFITAIFMPIQVILQRLVMLVLGSRLKEYIAIRFDIVANSLKILIAPLFLTENGYLLDYYLLTSILLSIFSTILSLAFLKYFLSFPVEKLYRYIRFSKQAYRKMKGLAYSSLFSTVLFILYYEMDLIVASQLYSLESVGWYALAFSLMNFVRTLSSIIYSPLLSYVNRLLGKDGKENIKEKFSYIVIVTVPLFMATTTVLVPGSEGLIFQWLGNESLLTSEIFQILLVGIFFFGLVNLGPLVATTLELPKIIYLLGIIPFLSFYLFLFLFEFNYPQLGILSIAYAKMISGLLSSLFVVIFLLKESIINKEFLYRLLGLSCLSYMLFISLNYFIPLLLGTLSQGFFMLVVNVLSLGLLIFIIWMIYLCLYKSTRIILKNIFKELIEIF